MYKTDFYILHHISIIKHVIFFTTEKIIIIVD